MNTGPTDDVPGLTSAQITGTVARFNQLNPYDPDLVPNLLKIEKTGTCLAISAKRYGIYNHDPDGTVEITKASEHGLGQLLDPLDPDAPVMKSANGARPWITDVWQKIIHTITTGERLSDILPSWAAKPAHTRLTISSPRLLKPFAAWNNGKPYSDQIKPANFMLSATVDPNYLPPGHNPDRMRLVAPYQRNASGQTPWRNLYDPTGPVEVTTEAQIEVDHRIKIKTYAQTISEYAFHPEAKFLDNTGTPCHRGSRGLLQRDHIVAGPWVIIGKEANQLDDVQTGVANPDDVTTTYDDGAREHLRDHVLPALSHLSGRELAKLVGCDHRTIDRIKDGQMPRRALYSRLLSQYEALVDNQPQERNASSIGETSMRRDLDLVVGPTTVPPAIPHGH